MGDLTPLERWSDEMWLPKWYDHSSDWFAHLAEWVAWFYANRRDASQTLRSFFARSITIRFMRRSGIS